MTASFFAGAFAGDFEGAFFSAAAVLAAAFFAATGLAATGLMAVALGEVFFAGAFVVAAVLVASVFFTVPLFAGALVADLLVGLAFVEADPLLAAAVFFTDVVDLAGAFFAAFFAGALVAAAFFAGALFAGAFLAGAFLAGERFVGAFAAGAFFVAAFFTAGFFVVFLAVDLVVVAFEVVVFAAVVFLASPAAFVDDDLAGALFAGALAAAFSALADGLRVTEAVTLFAAAAVLPAIFFAVVRAMNAGPPQVQVCGDGHTTCGEDRPHEGNHQLSARPLYEECLLSGEHAGHAPSPSGQTAPHRARAGYGNPDACRATDLADLASPQGVDGTSSSSTAKSEPGTVGARGCRLVSEDHPEPSEESPRRTVEPTAVTSREGRPGDSSRLRTTKEGGTAGAAETLGRPRPFSQRAAAGPTEAEGLRAVSEYRPVPPQVDLPALEHEVLDLWRENKTFDRTVERNRGAKVWTFYEGPPTANGRPGTHHVEARAFKDVFPRFKTMQGYQVHRKGGWDCHGLPVELAVEKELGFTGKADIEAYGVAAFNEKCRESVLRHVDLWEQLTDRMGFWIDMSSPYKTMDSTYVESVWWALKQIHDKGLLVQDYRVAPYCPRCGTGLSDHELAQGYETVTDPSVYVRLPLTSGPYAGKASLLVWTTTPWTLVSNTAVAAHPDVDYVVASDGSETLVVAEPLFDSVLGEGWTVQDTVRGADMERWAYQRPFELVEFPESEVGAHFVVLAEYVTTEDGTGLVHQSPAFGEDDMVVCKAYGLPVVTPVRPDGHFTDDVPMVGGQFFKHADADLVKDLESRGLMFRHLAYEHSYPHCWRCHTVLMYYAQPSWYVRTTQVKDALLRENSNTNWYPETVKWGRYGDWLDNNIDWALSRSRYWGTPLPIWQCEEGHQTCVGSLAELSSLTGTDQSTLDPHRPYVDDVTFACPTCGEEARRVPEVIDAWFDSGSMPFAQWGYPHVEGSPEQLEAAYPADFICEALDQTRGWFYTLMAIGTLVFDQSSYRNVLCLGLILAEDGRKMSKHLGNILEPMPLMEEHGADAVRWFMVASGSPWSARRVGHNTIQETVRKVLLTYWNTVAFHVLYARAAGWTPGGEVPAPADRPVLDRWLHAETARLVRDVTDALENFDTQRVGTLLAQFVDDLSNWYVRRSRRRFWDGEPAALATLHDTLETVTRLFAPLTPFITERVWQDLVRPADPAAPESVHLADWPTFDPSDVDEELSASVALARRLVELGRAARADAKVRTRQPLRRALVGSTAWARLDEELRAEVAEELNIGAIEPLSSAGADLVDHSAKGNFRALGKRFAKRTPQVAAAIAAADAAALSAALQADGRAVVTVDGEDVEVLPDEVIVSERPREGWSVVNEQGETVALDLELTPELVRAGLAREVVRMVQEARKNSGFEVSDRIVLTWKASGETAEALRENSELVANEVLAVEMREAEPVVEPAPPADGTPTGSVVHDDDLGLTFSVTRV